MSDVLGMFNEDVTEYTDQQKRIRDIIENLTEEKSRELVVSRRMYYYLRHKFLKNKPLKLSEKFFEKIIKNKTL